MSQYNKQLGEIGEKLAAKFLKKNGYKIVAKNYTTKYGEIDIIARKKNCLIFVEVKTRMSNEFGYPEQAIDEKKLLHFQNAVRAYLNRNDVGEKEISLDAISVEMADIKNPKIIHIENISS